MTSADMTALLLRSEGQCMKTSALSGLSSGMENISLVHETLLFLS